MPHIYSGSLAVKGFHFAALGKPLPSKAEILGFPYFLLQIFTLQDIAGFLGNITLIWSKS